MTTDEIYKNKPDDEPFRFDDSVAQVFPDMLQRSIPGYAASLDAIGSLAARYVVDGTRCYDLGCSLGAATLAMRQGIAASDVEIVAVDVAPAMITRCRAILDVEAARTEDSAQVSLLQGDVRDIDVANASMVVLNYTLQFIPEADRDSLLARIGAGMNQGGVLVLSEKVVAEDAVVEDLLVELHHEHKRRNNYSALEIARKRAALENVLVPETVAAHRRRLDAAGFAHSAVWLRHFNFVSIVAIR